MVLLTALNAHFAQRQVGSGSAQSSSTIVRIMPQKILDAPQLYTACIGPASQKWTSGTLYEVEFFIVRARSNNMRTFHLRTLRQ